MRPESKNPSTPETILQINFLDRSRYWECTNAEYHADVTHNSHSSLDLFMHSIEQYAARRVFFTAPNPAPTPAMLFGSLFHTAVLEPESLEKEYVLEEKHDRRTKVGKAGAADFIERSEGKIITSADDMDKAWAMRHGICRNSAAASLVFSPGISEVSMKCLDEETELPLKIRIDRLTENGTLVDLKSTDDVSPTAWSKTVYNFGYHRQAAMYLDCAKQYGIPGPFIFIAVSKTPPHEAVCYQLDAQAVGLGRAENHSIMSELRCCLEHNNWMGRWSNQVNSVGLPRYAYSVGR
jgi:exodeoxyribonuclease VIII